MSQSQTSRREFLRTGAALAATTAVPYIWTSRYVRAQGKNDRPNVASIGVGGMGTGDGRMLHGSRTWWHVRMLIGITRKSSLLGLRLRESARSTRTIAECLIAQTLMS